MGEGEDLGAVGHPHENRTPNLNSCAQRDSIGTTCSAAARGRHMTGPRAGWWWGQTGGSQGHTSQSISHFHTCSAHALQLFRAVFLIFFSCPHCSRSLLALEGQLNVGSATPLKGGWRTPFSLENSTNTSGKGSCLLHVFHYGKKMPFKI